MAPSADSQKYDIYGYDEYTWQVSTVHEIRTNVMEFHIQRESKTHKKSDRIKRIKSN